MAESAHIRIDFSGMMEEFIGKEGITLNELERIRPELDAAAQGMQRQRGAMKWRELPYNQDEIVEDILQTASGIRANYDNFVVLGIGGSALGPGAVHRALNHLHYNELSKDHRGGPRLYIEDNIDPERMAALLDVIDIKKTMFNVITKSGSTSETMSQMLIVVDLLQQHVGEAWNKQVIATTDAEKGNLIKIARTFGLKTFYVPDGVGGRFSELCPVGLLAAAVCGIDIKELLRGAKDMDQRCDNLDPWQNPASMLAALQVISMRRGKNISVMMPYADSLSLISDWYAQLWAESLGKRMDSQGNEVFAGQTPVKALGVTDQHSQVQLYTEGPFDKVVTFICVEKYRCTTNIPHGFNELPDVAFLGGHTQNELIAAEQRATEYALCKAGRPSHSIILPAVTPFAIGQLLCLFELMTAFAGQLLNIDAFDQPGVEEGKNATYALLGKAGFEAKRDELNSAPSKNPRWSIS